MNISKEIIKNLKLAGANFFLSVPCKLLANMISILEKDKEVYYSAVPREEEGMGLLLAYSVFLGVVSPRFAE